MRVVILAVYGDNDRETWQVKQKLLQLAQELTAPFEGTVDAVVMEMESTVDNLLANLRQLKG